MFTIDPDKKVLWQKHLREDWGKLEGIRSIRRELGKRGGKAKAKHSKSIAIAKEELSKALANRSIAEHSKAEQSTPSILPSLDGGRRAGETLTFDDMQSTWTEFRNDGHEDDLSIGLPRVGFPKLRDELAEFHLLARVDDIKSAFRAWLKDRYVPAKDTTSDIKSPLSVFAKDAVQYITELEKQSA
jgi:hypothetical protein